MLLVKNFTKNEINEKFLRRVAEESIKNILVIKKIKNLEIDLAIVGEKKMKTLNRIWRGKDKVTDVLSFESASPLRHTVSEVSGRTKDHSVKSGFKFIFPPDGIVHLGQIIICYSVAARQAREDGHSIDKEMAVLLIHGILHLASYDHEKSAQEARKMFELQEKIERKIKE